MWDTRAFFVTFSVKEIYFTKISSYLLFMVKSRGNYGAKAIGSVTLILTAANVKGNIETLKPIVQLCSYWMD